MDTQNPPPDELNALERRLSAWQPSAAGLDPDAMVFAAGRASARPNRRWLALAGVLAGSQLFTLVLLWPRPALPTVGPSSPKESFVASAPSSGGTPQAAPLAPAPSEWGTLRQRMLLADGDLPLPAGDEAMIPDDPPLYAFPVPPPKLMN